MAFTVTSKNNEKTFDKEIIYIGTRAKCDFKIDVGFDCILGLKYNAASGKCILVNKFGYEQFKFRGENLPPKLEIDKVCKIMTETSDEFITIKIIPNPQTQEVSTKQVSDVSSKQLETQRNIIESERISIIKEVSSNISELRRKISMNSKVGILLHIALFVTSFVCAFAVSNYLMGLPLSEDANVINIPTNTRLVLIYALVIYSVGLMLKQGVALFLYNKQTGRKNDTAEKLMVILPLFFYFSVYIINLLYYIASKSMSTFAVLISIFYVGTTSLLAVACGYFRFNSAQIRKELDTYEYREDFEHVVKSYQNWINSYISNLSGSKVQKIRDKLLNLQMWSLFESILGIITAPFLAYGVSNTLAMCFPEAAGWLRIGGLRFSPIFLVLAAFLIIFAFFSFVNGFLIKKKMSATRVIKQDGFNNYLNHGVEIYGLEGLKILDSEMRRYFIIGLSIILIEFTMNISYFTQEIGGDMKGIFTSAIAALVPTALLIAESIMLAHTKFEVNACEELLAKTDTE